MNEEQLTRFEYFVRSHLNRTKVETIIMNTLGPYRQNSVTPEMGMVKINKILEKFKLNSMYTSN